MAAWTGSPYRYRYSPGMSASATVISNPATLLQSGDPAPYTIVNPGGRANAVLVCDHGGHAVPGALNGLGLDPALLERARAAF